MGSAALGLLGRWLAVKATKRSIMALRAALLRKIFSLPRAYFDQADLGRLHTVVVVDSERVDDLTNAIVTLFLPATVISLALVATLFTFNPLLAGVLLITVPVMAVLSRYLSLSLRRRTREWHRAFESFSSDTHVALRNITLTKLHAAEPLEVESRASKLGDLSDAAARRAWLESAYPQVNNAIGALAAVVVLVVGGISVAHGSMSLGDLISFYAVLGLLRVQMGNVMMGLPKLIAGGASLDRLEGILDEPAREPYHGTRPIRFRGGVRLEHVHFAYGSKPVLNGIDMHIEPGERVALIGPNGAGKSTVLSLITGLYAPRTGRVLMDGEPLAELDPADVRRRMGVVLQNPLILPGTIRDNIAYGRPNATAEEIERVAADAGAADFIGLLPSGLETAVGDDGVLLSGGQRQRLAIARALLGEPSLLILDEPTTYLDESSPRELARITQSPATPAILMVSHDPAVYSLADRVYELVGGRAIERAASAGGDAFETLAGSR
jgi:ABC-type multidrug transport system fused ATPase/permease subunit